MSNLFEETAVNIAKALPRGGHRFLKAASALLPGLRHYPVMSKFGPIVADLREPSCYPVLIHGQPPHWKNLESFFANLPFEDGGMVFDVGANIGLTAMIFAKKAGHVHAFEPAPRAVRMLRRNVRDIENIEVHEVAVSDAPGVLQFHQDAIISHSSIDPQGETTVKAITLDSLDVDADFIKIDVEGFEDGVLRGATRQLKRGVPIMFEGRVQEDVDRCTAILQAVNPGYKIVQMLPSKANWLATV